MYCLASRFRRYCTPLLLLAIVYQSGTCSCGVWDQSLWSGLLHQDACRAATCHQGASGSQAVRRRHIGAEACCPETGVAATAPAVTADHLHQCRGVTKLVERDRSRDWRELRDVSTDGAVSSAMADEDSLSLADEERASRLRFKETGTPARYRALLQVYRL